MSNKILHLLQDYAVLWKNLTASIQIQGKSEPGDEMHFCKSRDLCSLLSVQCKEKLQKKLYAIRERDVDSLIHQDHRDLQQGHLDVIQTGSPNGCKKRGKMILNDGLELPESRTVLIQDSYKYPGSPRSPEGNEVGETSLQNFSVGDFLYINAVLVLKQKKQNFHLLKSSTFVWSVNEIFSQKPLESSKLFFFFFF